LDEPLLEKPTDSGELNPGPAGAIDFTSWDGVAALVAGWAVPLFVAAIGASTDGIEDGAETFGTV
jgi:hypothetical protein